MKNLFLQTDVYKFGHRVQYPPKTTKVWSYLTSRGSRLDYHNDIIVFGLQYYLKKYLLDCPTTEHVDEFMEVANEVLGPGAVTREQLDALVELGYLPIEISSVPEGTRIGLQQPIFTITNTHPDFYWLVNYIETLLIKVWYPITVATTTNKYLELFKSYADITCDNNDHIPFQRHSFGYRGCSSEETAAIGGAAELTQFMGTDTVAGILMLRDFYNAKAPIGLSVPASEHSVMCSWSKENDDEDAIRNMLETYPTGIVSIVSDTYNLWTAISDYFAGSLKELVLSRDGKTVIRPDSGDPVKIICGDWKAPLGSPEFMGVIQLLDKHFGSTRNNKGYKVLNPKVGAIYGDAITLERANVILQILQGLGYASSNIVFGVGGLSLQNCTRDTFKMALKATYCEIDGEERGIMKEPITDTSKKSRRGLLTLVKEGDELVTYEDQSWDKVYHPSNLIQPVYRDGKLLKEYDLDSIRKLIN